MAVSITRSNFNCVTDVVISSTTGVRYVCNELWSHDMKDSSGNYLMDRVFGLTDYSLTTGAGNLDIDLYDLGTLDAFGTGAGEDNLGLSHANAKIYAMAVRNQEVSGGGTLRIDNNGATNPWTGIFGSTRVMDLAQGAYFQIFLGESGIAVTDASSHIMRVSAQTNNCTIDIIFYSSQS